MAIHPLTEGAYNSFPPYIRLAWGLDTSWKEHGSCRGMPEAALRYWDAEPEGRGSKPFQAQFALAVCSNCHVQWDCVTFAIKAHMDSCTWAVVSKDRRFLSRQLGDTWEDEIEKARANEESVASMVVRLRKREAERPVHLL